MSAHLDPLPDEPAEYVVGRLRQALAEDPRVGEHHIDITIAGRRVVLGGEVATEARREAITTVAGELLPGHDVQNQTSVAAVPAEPPPAERLS